MSTSWSLISLKTAARMLLELQTLRQYVDMCTHALQNDCHTDTPMLHVISKKGFGEDGHVVWALLTS